MDGSPGEPPVRLAVVSVTTWPQTQTKTRTIPFHLIQNLVFDM